MSGSSPEDLAVAFRSVTRRLHEAQGDQPTDEAVAPTAELHVLLADAGRLLHTGADPSVIADAIEALPADRWDPELLEKIRTIALDVGRLLRHITALGEA